jgi:hypothetical protein
VGADVFGTPPYSFYGKRLDCMLGDTEYCGDFSLREPFDFSE